MMHVHASALDIKENFCISSKIVFINVCFRSKSDSSMAAELVAASVHSHPSSISLNEVDTEDQGLQGKQPNEDSTIVHSLL